MVDRDRVRFYGLSPVTQNAAEKTEEKYLAASGQDWINYWHIWRQCHLLKAAALRKGLRIVNATRGGLLDMFDRKPYEEILAESS
jgi:hypothetical protein